LSRSRRQNSKLCNAPSPRPALHPPAFSFRREVCHDPLPQSLLVSICEQHLSSHLHQPSSDRVGGSRDCNNPAVHRAIFCSTPRPALSSVADSCWRRLDLLSPTDPLLPSSPLIRRAVLCPDMFSLFMWVNSGCLPTCARLSAAGNARECDPSMGSSASAFSPAPYLCQ
jgi:hypothetical protein